MLHTDTSFATTASPQWRALCSHLALRRVELVSVCTSIVSTDGARRDAACRIAEIDLLLDLPEELRRTAALRATDGGDEA